MKNSIVILLITLMVISCKPQNNHMKEIDWQGHRGARGNFPENTWPAFQFAMDNEMNTLEMDVVITADSQVVISHEPFLNHKICLDSTGNSIEEDKEKEFNIYQMNYAELQKFDCGTKINSSFPNQSHMVVAKPLLMDILKEVKDYAKEKQLALPNLNVEIKYQAGNEGLYHPSIAVYSNLVYKVLSKNYPKEKWNIQSFDFDVLKYWHKTYPEVPLAALVEENTNWKKHIDYLGFTPAIYSPYHILLEGSTIEALQAAGMKVIPWTVNETKVAEHLLSQGVDGIITDYPEIASEFKDNQ